VSFTHQVADGLHSAIIKATKPAEPAPDRAAAHPTATATAGAAAVAGCGTAGLTAQRSRVGLSTGSRSTIGVPSSAT
jgi:hypothetical protein